MSENNLDLIAHLMRRAGFGATRDELEVHASKSYEAIVEDLLHPEWFPDNEDVIHRYYDGELINKSLAAEVWVYRMANTKHPLQEKMAFFWHHVFATSNAKVEHTPSIVGQIAMFRRICMTDMRTLLLELSKDPAMISWLDNYQNVKDEPNENYGRELLELFSMGEGNYTEEDVKSAAYAFTGWTFTAAVPAAHAGFYPSEFHYKEEDHDDSVKTFLGETGRFNGEDIIDIIVRQPATARFISRHLYNFFVADDPQVAAWRDVAPEDPEAIDTLMKAYTDSGGELRSILRVLFNSDFFKETRFRRVKSPAELVAGIIKLVGSHQFPDAGILGPGGSTTLMGGPGGATTIMGQQLLYPPSVEGWHTGQEWIDGGTLNERINFAVQEVGDATRPGIQSIINRLRAEGTLPPEEFLDRCLELTGPLTVGSETRDALLRFAESGGELKFGSEAERAESETRIVRLMQLIVASREYQFA